MATKDWEFAELAEKNYQKMQEEIAAERKKKKRLTLILKVIVWTCDILFQLFLFYAFYRYLRGH